MLLSQIDMGKPDKILLVLALYAIMSAVRAARANNEKLNPTALLHLYVTQGLQGHKAKAVLDNGNGW